MLLFSSSLSLSFYAFQFVFGLGIGDELAKGLLMCFIYESSVALVRALIVHVCLCARVCVFVCLLVVLVKSVRFRSVNMQPQCAPLIEIHRGDSTSITENLWKNKHRDEIYQHNSSRFSVCVCGYTERMI